MDHKNLEIIIFIQIFHIIWQVRNRTKSKKRVDI